MDTKYGEEVERKQKWRKMESKRTKMERKWSRKQKWRGNGGSAPFREQWF